jgi:hypothetical protein
MADNKARPTRSRPAKAETVPDPAEETVTVEETTKPARKQRQPRKPAAAKLPVFHEDTDTGVLTPVGEFKGDKAPEALEGYFTSLEAEDQDQALAAATYAVETPRGLVRLTLTQKLDIQPR